MLKPTPYSEKAIFPPVKNSLYIQGYIERLWPAYRFVERAGVTETHSLEIHIMREI
jgi:hypothetical protein